MTRPAQDVLDRIDRIFADRVDRGVAPSSVWGVFDGDGLVASGGHGDRGDGAAPDSLTVYRIASCTKSFTAASVLLLARRGLLDLDDPISRWVPAFSSVALPSEDSPEPTIRMLLTMSAGFPTDDPWADRQESISDDEFDAVLRAGLLFDSVPGTGFAYSNLGYALLGRAIAHASGVPYTDFVQTELIDPLNLAQTRFTPPDGSAVAVGTRNHGGDWERLPMSGPGGFSSIGGLFSSVEDLSRWARFLSSAFETIRSPRSGGSSHHPTNLTTADRRLMQQGARVIPSSGPRPTAYGLGLMVEDSEYGPIASHTGGYPGFSAHMRWSVSNGLGVVAFENATGARVPAAAVQAHDLLLGSIGAPSRLEAVLPETRRAADAVGALLGGWDDDLADRLFTPNVALDVPYERRRAAIGAAFDKAGASPTSPPGDLWTSAPSHLGWSIRGTSGEVRVQIRLAPLREGRVQTLLVEVAPDD
jgi:CubicO group peptidase (beta-lactamase class C family)